ncbi:hypothetical protein J3R30DRAFT_3298872 [Lentinula aciculospora]|uniref:Kinase n=1 Tax=Lentinula aciculospora TaxID=153920 RepID=A0A9W9A1S3_9AGAR|nr:hypothetical protein J3R30DRAFT_3298872 [Lentinula aciculospora]
MSFSQVGGHANTIRSTEDGSLLMKPVTTLEHEFYLIIAQARAMDTTGGLEGGGTGIEGGIVDTTDRHPVVNTPSQQYLVLSNLLYSFTKPNVLDLKLGTVFYDKRDLGCSEEKKARMIKAARETTSGESGIRLTGFQVTVHRLAPLLTLKSYGKSLKKEQLPEGIRRAFPVLVEPRTDLGLPAIVLLPILRSIHTSVLHLHSILKEVEIRIVGGSLLVVWEGDEQRARDGVQWMEEKEARIKERERTRSETDEDGNDDEYMDSDDDEEDTKPSAPYTLCLIDFAHTRFVPGQGPDVGVLLGLVTFAKLVEGRIREVKEAVKQ